MIYLVHFLKISSDDTFQNTWKRIERYGKSIRSIFLSIFNKTSTPIDSQFSQFFFKSTSNEYIDFESGKTRLFRQRVKFIWGKRSWEDETFPVPWKKKKEREKRCSKMSGVEKGDCWIIQKPRILKAKHSPWTEYVSRFKSARGREKWNGENKAMRTKWREFEDSPSWDSKAKLSILLPWKVGTILWFEQWFHFTREKVKRKTRRDFDSSIIRYINLAARAKISRLLMIRN